jgi:hypothetical protein
MMEIPILFNTEMVRAIIEGTKTQTRRVIKIDSEEWYSTNCRATDDDTVEQYFKHRCYDEGVLVPCPYGKPGDRLWVRETFLPIGKAGLVTAAGSSAIYATERDYYPAIQKVAKEKGIKWKSSRYMPRTAARIFLEITMVRVEQLNDITEDDAISEGIIVDEEGMECWHYLRKNFSAGHPITSFETLWESLAGPGSWDINPWVWVIEFKRIETAAQ